MTPLKVGQVVIYQGLRAVIAAEAMDRDLTPAWYIEIRKEHNTNWPYQGKVVAKVVQGDELEAAG